MKKYRCTICGFETEAEERPQNCEVCGAEGSFVEEVSENGISDFEK